MDRSPGWKEEASANFLRGGGSTGGSGGGVRGVGGLPGSANPAARGGARRCPPPAVPFSWPLPSAARAGVTAACGKLGAGNPGDPKLP